MPIKLLGGEIECVSEFKYLGSMESGGGVMVEVGERIAQASGALHEPTCNLSLRTKRQVYKAVVLKYCYIYRSETWTTKRVSIWKLEVFHNCYLRAILGITALQQ